MTPEQYNRVGQLYHQALELESAHRAEFLERECAGDELLRREVESLIASHEEQETFLAAPAVEVLAKQVAEEKTLSINQQIGHYRVLSLLGKGGMGEVYLAQDTTLGRKVALKLLPARFTQDADRLRRFVQEAKAASALNHPSILTIHEIGQESGNHFTVTEFVDGQTLRQRMKDGQMSLTQSLDVGIQVANALRAAHEAGITHRDIKPENVMVRPDSLVKVLDFGLAKLTEEASVMVESGGETVKKAKTESGLVMGTPQYMSPEQARGQRVDNRTDIFSLGATLYEMVTGRKPFEGETVSDVIAAILMTEPAPLSQIQPEAPAALQLIVSKALTKEREARYQSAKDFELDLKRLRQETGMPSGQDDFKQPSVGKAVEASAGNPIAKLKRDKRVATAAIVALLAIALTVAYLVRGRFNPSPETAPGLTTLAVLPFQTLNAPEELRFLGVGIPDAIISRLAKIKQIRARPISAALRYENQNINSQEIGRSLACDYLLSGVLQKAGGLLRVSVQLIQAKDGAAIWADRYDVARQDLISLEDTIAEEVSSALGIRLTEEERSSVYRRYTEERAAYELYLKGRWRLNRPGREERLAAVTTFENALQFEPQYARAYAGLATACGSLRHGLAPEAEVKMWDERAKQAASRALELDPNLAEAHEALAAVYRFTEFEWERTIEEASKAIELNPNLEWPHYYRARAFFHLGLLEETDQEARAGLEINPENRGEALVLRYLAAFHSGQFAQAAVLAEEYLRLNQNRPDAARLFEAFYYHGMRDRAEELLKQDRSGGPRQELWRQAVLASYLAARDEKSQAEAILRKITPASETFHHASYSIGAAYAQLGAKSKARLWLARAKETGFPCYPWYERDPLLQPLRDDAEFQRFMADLKKSWEAAKKRYGSEQK